MAASASTRFLVLLKEFSAFRKISWTSAGTNFHRQSRFLCHVAKEDGSLTLASLDLGNKPRKFGKSKAMKLEGSFVTEMGQGKLKAVKNDKMKVVKEKKPAEIVSPLFSAKSFEELGLPDSLLDSLEREGFSVPTDVQSAAVPAIIKGHDAVIQSYTGSGKTLAYLLPILSEIGPLAEKSRSSHSENDKRTDIQAMIVAPSRELGMQIVREVEKLLGPVHRRMVQQLVGGANRMRQEEALKKNKPAIVVGTPGRIAEISKSGKLHTHGCRFLVLDEVDELLSFNFREDIHRILEHVGKRSGAGPKGEVDERANRQTILVSATVPFSVIRAAKSWSHEPVLVQANKVTPLDTVQPSAPVISLTPTTSEANGQIQTTIQSLPPALKHYYCISKHQHKVDTLRRCVHALDAQSVIAFMNHSRQLKDVVYKLEARGMNSAEMHGDLGKLGRSTVLKKFKNGEIKVLVTNELSARGLDVAECDLVVNLELPTDAVHYAHRAGRTGRLGRKGTVVTVCEESQVFIVKKMEKQLGLPFLYCEFVDGELLVTEEDKAIISSSHTEIEKGTIQVEMMKLMIRRLSPQASKFFQRRLLETGTLRNALSHCPNELLFCCERGFSGFSDRNLSYRERLRSGIVDIKKDDAIDLFQEMIGSRPLPSLVDFSKLFSAVARTKQYNLVLDLCKQMELKGIAHNNYTLSIMINCFCRCRKLCYAFSALGKIMKLGYEPDTITFSTLINGFCLEGRVPEALELVDRMVEMKHRPDLIMINTLVNGLCLKGKVSEAVVLIDRMVESGFQPNAVTYGPVLNVMCKSGKTALAMNLLRKMEERKIKLDAAIYNILIDSLCKDGNLNDSLDLFSEMELKGIKANNITYTTLIGGFCSAGRWDDGAQLLRDMITRKITPDVFTFSVLIDCFVKEGKLREAKELYNEMITRGLSPDTITYNSLIDGFCKENRLDEANQMLDLMVSKGCDPDIVTFNILINGYCKAKRTDDGLELFHKMSLRGVVADTFTYNTLIQGFCELGKINVAKELFQEMVSRRIPPDIVTYKILLDGLCDNGELEKALEIFEKIQKSKMELDIGIYSIIIHGMCNASKVDDAWDLFCSLPLKGVKPDVKTYTIMIGGLCKKGSLSEAELLFRKMEEDGHAPDGCTYNILIKAHLGDGDATKSAKLIEEMKRCRFSADASTIKMVIDMLSDGKRSGAGPKGEVDERANRQTVLVSATVPFSVIRAAKSWSHEPVLVQANKVTPLDTIQPSAPEMRSRPRRSVIAFMNHSRQLKDVVYKLEARGMNLAEMHGDLGKLGRTTVLKKFKNGEIKVLVTNELSARGLDVAECDLVVNLELPTDAVHYAHRAGRTGRLGRKGTVVTVCEESQVFIVKKMEKQLGLPFLYCEFVDGELVVTEEDKAIIREIEKGTIQVEMMKLMIRRLSPQALSHCPNELLFCCERGFSGFSDRNLSYRERLRSGIVDIKKDDAIDLFQDMIGSRPLPSLVDFSKLFSAVARTKQYNLVLDLCKQMELKGIAHNNYTLSIMINCFCRCRKLCYAFSALGKIMKLGYEPNTVIFNTLFNGLCLEGRVSEAVELFDRMVGMGHKPTLITISTLINGLCLKGKVSEAVVLIERMVESGFQPNAVTYGPVLNVMCKSGKTALALDLLRKMEERNIKLDAANYNIIIDSLCKDGSLDDAFNLFNEMEMKGIKADVFTYTNLIGGFCNAGRWNDGAKLLRDMITRRITPDVVTFSVLIDSFVKEGKLLEAEELHKEMITRGIALDTITYNSLIDGFCKENRLDEANQMLDLMVSKGCDPDIVTLNILINGYCKAKRTDDGLELFHKMSLRGVVADTFTYNTLIQGFCELRKLSVAKELFQEMVSRGIPPDIVTYKILLDGLCDNGELEKALEIFEKIQKSKMELDIGIYNIIIHGMCNASKVADAWDLFCSLPLKGVKLDVKAYSVMIGGQCKKGSLCEADILLRKMREEGHAPDGCTYNILIRAHLGDGDATTAAILIEEMKSGGFSADVSTVKMVINMLSSGELDKSFLDMLSATRGSFRNKP
ncbi:Pentatricopeptide repeat [Arabidopsis thaliana x Arabidopsis arenosa]|uniref:Pentatricopeptide repeat n=1 Tax=Arabidopsis thaliana x Arabidopsis arenosa TaxID=1240361 RepID=A0A8T2C0H0_9BRAS|nr:Pentatricopeptide repeat [Arabidopsis thaliana x Arabidopsis arenosa]